MSPASPPPIVMYPSGPLEEDRPCLACGYNLRGLTAAAVCPECGMPVVRSLQGNLLRFSSPEHLATLHRGVIIIEVMVIVQLIGTIVAVAAALTLAFGGANIPEWTLVAAMLAGSVATLVSIGGWWLFSTPDAAVVGTDTGVTARKLVRVTVVIMAAATVIEAVATVSGAPPAFTAAGAPTPQGAAAVVEIGAQIASVIAWVVWFFAAMRYVRWMAPRLPDRRVYDWSRLLMWLGPVLYIFGCGIGHVVAAVLYFLMLNFVRGDLKAIRREQSGELVPPVV